MQLMDRSLLWLLIVPLVGCPLGHQIRFLVAYEEKEWKSIKRNVYWGGTVTIGEDH